MIRRVKNLISKVKEVRNKIKYKRISKSIESKSNKVYLDLGSTNVKIIYKGEMVKFKSSIRKVIDMNEISVAQKNVVKVNNKMFIVGEALKSNGTTDYKYQKQYIPEIIFYGLKLIQSKGIEIDDNLQVNILLPYNELKYKELMSKKINGLYDFEGKEISITVKDYFIEGECSSEYYRRNYKDDNNICLCNIGGKTTDIISINSYGAREKIVSINTGVISLMSDLVRFTKAKNSSVLMSWLDNGYCFSKSEEENIKEVKRAFVESVWNDLYQVVSLTNPDKTTILLTGGGSILTKDEFKEIIPRGYKVKTMNDTENVFADILGMVALSSEENIIIPEDNTPEDTPEDEVKKRRKRKNKYDDFVLLFEEGRTKEEICNILEIANQTYANMKSKYQKGLKAVS